MTIDEIERAAMQAARMNALSPPTDLLDAHLYLALYFLYATHYAGQLTREQAGPMKQKMLMQYNQQKSSYEFDMQMARSTAKLWREIEAAGCAFAKEPSMNTADAFFQAVYHVKRKTGVDELIHEKT